MSGLLEGLIVADFSWVGAGPRATKDLADYGATVIKIESRKRLDLGRQSPPFKDGKRDPDGSLFFTLSNTSKLGVTINLGDPKGVEIARRLVAKADIVVENFGKGFMDRAGLSAAELDAVNPRLIQVSVSVAGRTGPLADLRGYGNSAAALSGLAALSGWPDRAPHMPPFAYGDVVAPMFATVAILAAIENRRLTGLGRRLDISQVEPLVHVLADEFVRFQRDPANYRKPGNSSPTFAPQGVYPCRGTDQWCALAVRTDAEWRELCILAGLAEELIGLDLAERRARGVEIDAVLAAWTRRQDKHLLADRLTAAGIAAEAVNDGRDVFSDPELIETGHFAAIDHAVIGPCEMPAPPVRFAEGDVRVGPSPLLGEHNRQIFIDLLGMDPADMDALVESGALA